METPGVYDTHSDAIIEVVEKILRDHPVAYHPIFAKKTKSVTAAVFLSQLFYWSGGESGRSKGSDPDGWIYKTQKEMEDETGLTRYEQENARKVLVNYGLIKEARRGIPGKMHYKVNVRALIDLINGAQTTMWETSNVDCGKPANNNGEKPHCNSETTTEITPETTDVHTSAHSRNEETLLLASVYQENFGTRPKAGQLKLIRDAMSAAPLERWEEILRAAFRAAMRYPNPTPGSVAGMINSFAKNDWNTERPQPGMVENMRVLN